jgi:hypothetical protein
MCVPEREEKQKGEKIGSEEIMAENCPHLIKEMNLMKTQ